MGEGDTRGEERGLAAGGDDDADEAREVPQLQQAPLVRANEVREEARVFQKISTWPQPHRSH